MNKQSSTNEQFFRFLILALVGFYFFQHFTNPAGKTAVVAVRPARTLTQAFAGIDPAAGPALTPQKATAEVTSLHALVDANQTDALSYWARLRIGLIQQYVLHNLVAGTHHTGFLSLGGLTAYYPQYDEVANSGQNDAVQAQATYQEGDLLWRESIQHGAHPSPAAATAIENLVHRGRGYSKFMDDSIYVPVIVDPAKVPLVGVPPGGFHQVLVSSLRGSLAHPNPQGIVDRLNSYYQDDGFYRAFDFAVRHLGNDPRYSYGLAVLLFAMVTRLCMNPLTKKQYESMRGMALIGPEMKKIQERYKGKTEQPAQMAMIKEVQALQKRHGVNPYLGCGLSLVQMPIFFLLVYPLIQHYEPKMELAGASFLWIGNLAQRDIPLLVLYGISMLFSFRLSSTPPADEAQRNQQVIMSVVMPVLFPFFISTYPAAFTLYWMTFNVMSTIFQWQLIKKADPRKNVLKTLMGADLGLLPATPAASPLALPARPQNGVAGGSRSSGKSGSGSHQNGTAGKNAGVNGSGRGEEPSLDAGKAGLNGSLNGSTGLNGKNGKANPPATGIDLTNGQIKNGKGKKKN